MNLGFLYKLKLMGKIMSIEGQVKQILTLVTAQTVALTALSTAVANLHDGETVDLGPLTTAISGVSDAVASIKADLEVDDSAPQPPTT